MSKKQKLFNPDKYKNWHGVGFGSWTGTATDAKEKHKQKEAQKKAALKAEQEQKKKEFKELQDKKKAAQRQKRKRIAEKAKINKTRKQDKNKKYRHRAATKAKPQKTASGKYSAALGLFHKVVVFGSTYATAEDAAAVLDHKLKLKNDLFAKIELTKQQAFELNTYKLFKNYLLTEDRISYRLIIRMYGKEQ